MDSLESILEYAKEYYLKNPEGEIMPTWTLFLPATEKEKAQLWLVITPWRDNRERTGSFGIVQLIMFVHRVRKFSLICESWVRIISQEEHDKQIKEGKRNEDYGDKKEMVSALIVSDEGKLGDSWEMIRKDGKVTELWPQKSKTIGIGGDIPNLLPNMRMYDDPLILETSTKLLEEIEKRGDFFQIKKEVL